MLKIIRLIPVLVLMLSTTFAKEKPLPKELETDVETIFPFTDLSSEMIAEVLQGMRPEIAIEFREGTKLPIKYAFSNGLFALNLAPNLSFKVEKTCYIRVVRKKGYLSFDLKNWEKLKKALLSSETPKTKVGLSPDKSHVLIEANIDPDL